ncbi:MAG: aromatic ring-hydroxylating dioxygenase subunit alpha [Candidatus Lustribacter sp.]|jgi:vanillate O-demethylase monooxygenase subunit
MPEAPFLKNAWYAVATSGAVRAAPLGRRICNEPVVIFRRADGSVAMLDDRCPHRKAQLSCGAVIDDALECRYHGFRFSGDGACVLIPAGDVPPAAFRARAYPVVEQHGFVFAWFGEAGKADPSLIPDLSRNDSPDWAAVRDYLYVKAGYKLLIDNIMDLTHTAFVHKTTLAGPQVAETPLEVSVNDGVVRGERVMRNVDPAPIFRAALGRDGKIDRWQIMEYHPPILAVAILAAKEPGTVTTLDVPTHILYNLFTPETERSTHYFWSTVRCWALDDMAVSKTYLDMSRTAFNEDVEIVEGQQRMIDDDPRGSALAYFSADKAALEARRLLTRLIRAEASTP